MDYQLEPRLPAHRTQRALSMASDTKKHRGLFYQDSVEAYFAHPLPAPPSTLSPLKTTRQSPTPISQLSHDLLAPLHDDSDLYKRLKPSPLPAPSYSTADPKKIAKAAQRQKRELLVQKLQHQQAEALERAKQEKLDREQAKLERKQKTEEYKQMYQNQHDYQQEMEERRIERRQQRSLPIYPSGSSSTSSDSCSTLETRVSQSISNELYYHSSRHYHRDRSSSGRDHLDSLSSAASSATRSSQTKAKVSAEQMRSFSLKSTSTKSMYDLRPWSGAPQSPMYDQSSFEVDRDESASSQGWDSLMDTLHSPTMSAPLESPLWDTPSKEEMEHDVVLVPSHTTMSFLPPNNSKNGNGRYLLGKFVCANVFVPEN